MAFVISAARFVAVDDEMSNANDIIRRRTIDDFMVTKSLMLIFLSIQTRFCDEEDNSD